MDDALYNQIFLKPRFQFDFDMNSKMLLSRIKEYGTRTATYYKIKGVGNHIIIDIPEKDSHFWSPQLQIEIEEISEKKSKIKGLFGPKPQVWTFFMFLHFVVGTAFVIFAILAYSNWSLKNAQALPLIMVAVLPIVWVILYFVGSLGKLTGQKQMDGLKKFMKQTLQEIKGS
ncbi:GTP-binding protein [Tenacibaculum sp. UWU-22]|uniref:GTP-binding protein n=1 Tax=Tenacibaculum sp. UWU-22 TaxID=3234187 RepID=UPI0034DAEFA1